MWTAILIMVVASASNNIGKALQKQATRTLPRLAMKRDIIQQYLRSKTWLTGLFADIGGAVMQIAAFASAPVRDAGAGNARAGAACTTCRTAGASPLSLYLFPRHVEQGPPTVQHSRLDASWCLQVSVLQPVSSVGLAILVVFSHFYLKVKW
jgi:hypothetical protein